ncbi:uncharacterized protein YeaO (DUF488 family) [Microbacterium sp. W4I4]|uniref:DUF488 domain-containing protein n=1 Tax=Microbacterium sp. W4I4 TaxID=3042295 RepID=UPI00277DDF25|nr:DUF488 family protein [Microbacterium sp. W4I4]MDQ0614996.1 uncharacterized protein YeaO (DUF488 family) [Microbacterium sp. W4I4]
MELRRKRAYDNASADDGFRVLIDRLWPRGVSKEQAAIDLWAKDVAPSTELRRVWHAAPDADFEVNAERYRAQLEKESAKALQELVEELQGRPVVTLVYALHDTEHNHAVVLEGVLRRLLE